jgi:hypothetical protein
MPLLPCCFEQYLEYDNARDFTGIVVFEWQRINLAANKKTQSTE